MSLSNDEKWIKRIESILHDVMEMVEKQEDKKQEQQEKFEEMKKLVIEFLRKKDEPLQLPPDYLRPSYISVLEKILRKNLKKEEKSYEKTIVVMKKFNLLMATFIKFINNLKNKKKEVRD